MNNARRKAIDTIIAKLEALQMDIQHIAELVDEIRSEEEDYRDNMPENLQGSERHDRASEAIDELDSAQSELESIDLDSVIETLRSAAGG